MPPPRDPLQPDRDYKADHRTDTREHCGLYNIFGVYVRKDGEECATGRPGHGATMVTMCRHRLPSHRFHLPLQFDSLQS
jgi:hypothetical protein